MQRDAEDESASWTRSSAAATLTASSSGCRRFDPRDVIGPRHSARPGEDELSANRQRVPQRGELFQTCDDSADAFRVLWRESGCRRRTRSIRNLTLSTPPEQIADGSESFRGHHVVLPLLVGAPDRRLSPQLLPPRARLITRLLSSRANRNERAAPARRASEHALRQPELRLHHVVDQVVRNMSIEPRRRIHHLCPPIAHLHHHGVPPLACASKRNVHGFIHVARRRSNAPRAGRAKQGVPVPSDPTRVLQGQNRVKYRLVREAWRPRAPF